MDKRYVIYKCCADRHKKPITWLTACDLREAQEALRWLCRHHHDDEDLHLGEGEFFEVLDEDHITPEELEEALAAVQKKK